MSRYIFRRKSNRFRFSYFLPFAIIIAGFATLLDYIERQELRVNRIQSDAEQREHVCRGSLEGS